MKQDTVPGKPKPRIKKKIATKLLRPAFPADVSDRIINAFEEGRWLPVKEVPVPSGAQLLEMGFSPRRIDVVTYSGTSRHLHDIHDRGFPLWCPVLLPPAIDVGVKRYVRSMKAGLDRVPIGSIAGHKSYVTKDIVQIGCRSVTHGQVRRIMAAIEKAKTKKPPPRYKGLG